MSDAAESIEADERRQRAREDEVEEVSEDGEEEEDDEETAGEESRRESTAASLSSLVSTATSTRGSGGGGGGSRKRQRPIRSHALVELTSLDELALPTNAARSIKYTCIAASRRLLVLGTSTGSVYVFARFASKQRANAAAAAAAASSSSTAERTGGGRLAAVPLHVYTTKDGALHTVRISPSEQLIAVGGESGRVSVLSLAAGVGGAAAAAAGAAAGAAAPPLSPASALIHTVPGEARSPDRVNCLCWSSDSSLLYAAHASGMVVQHKIGIRRSVFRSPSEQLFRLKGPAVQMEYAAAAAAGAAAAGGVAAGAARLLVSTPEATFVHDLHAGKAYQVGNKLRNAPMGACWMRGEGGAADDFVLAARQNGRIWEASTIGIVYKTHQLRQSATMPTLDPLSFRADAAAAAPQQPSSHLQQAAIDTETARTTVHLGTLTPIAVDSAATPLPSLPPPPSSDALSLPSTSSSTATSTTVSTSSATTVSSSVISSTATVASAAEPATRFVCSAVRSTLLVADIDRSQLVVVSDLGHVIRDWAVCGADVFVLFAGGCRSGSGSGPLLKYTLLPVERAAERLLARKGAQQAARLVLSVRPLPASTVDAAPPRDTVAAGWPMPLIEKIQTALAAIRKKESESLRRQLNDLVCGGGGERKASVGDDNVAVVSGSLSSLAVARTRRVSTSDRYLDRRRVGEEGEDKNDDGAASEYEDGEGGVIRRERTRRRRGQQEDERSRSSPDNLRPLAARATAASSAKTRAATSPRREDSKRREELKRAKRLLESDAAPLQTEHRDSLRTLLELGSPPPIQFKHSVTVASVARNLAELARAAPPSITDLLVQRRTSVKASPGSGGGKRGGGARVVKAIRPQRPTSGGAVRKSAAIEEEERNSNVVMAEGTKKSTRTSALDDEAEDEENNVEWRREGKRMGGVFLREEGGALTRATAAAPAYAEAAAEAAAAAAAAELRAQHCDRCGLHKSWLAVFLFGTAVHRVTVVVREGAYGRGGVPTTPDEWCDALDAVVSRTGEKRHACAKCARAMQKALESVPVSGRFCDGLRPAATRIDAEAMREKVLSLPEDVLRAAVFGVRTERKRGGRRRSEVVETREEKGNGVEKALAVPTAAPAVVEEEMENGNGEEEEEEEKKKKEEGMPWVMMMDAREMLTAALFALGREGLREVITQRAKRRTLESLADADWALLARLLAPRECAGTAVPIQMARALLKEYGMQRFVSIEGPQQQSATVPKPASPSIRGGAYGRRVAPIDSPTRGAEPATVSWPMDTSGVCPMCSLALTAVVGGGRTVAGGEAPAAAAAAANSTVACYPCGHAYHAVCIGEASKRRQPGVQPGISPVCIVCRVRARRSKAAAAAK